MAFKLICPSCKKSFAIYSKDAKTWPTECPNCAYDTSLPDGDEISLPFLGSVKTKLTDQVYRDMEKGSEVRAQLAADAAGVPVSEMSNMKITNLNDRRDAEIAAMPVQNTVTQVMDHTPASSSPWGFQSASGLGFSGAVGSGPFANMGARTQSMVREQHAKLTNYQGVGDRPATEILNPGYRRRV